MNAYVKNLLIAATLFGAASATGCGSTTPSEQGDYRTGTRSKAATLSSFGTCDDLNQYVVDRYADQLAEQFAGGYYWPGGFAVDDSLAAPEADGGDSDSGGESPDTFTDTNVQEAGVDEADTFKTNGDTIFYAESGGYYHGQDAQSTVRVLDAWPAEDASLIAEIDVAGHSPRMLLDGDKLVVISSEWRYADYYYVDDCEVVTVEPGEEGDPDVAPAPDEDVAAEEAESGADEALPAEPREGCVEKEDVDMGALGEGPVTHITIFDVSDPASPSETSHVEFEGNLVDTRRVDNMLHLVTQSNIGFDWSLVNDIREDVEDAAVEQDWWQMQPEERAAAIDQLAAELRPRVAEALEGEDVVGRVLPRVVNGEGEAEALFGCADVMRPGIDSNELSLLSVLSLDIDEPSTPTGSALVSYGWHVYASRDNLYIARDSRGWDWWGSESPEALTHIYRFALDGDGADYAGSGSVTGFLKDRYSLSEHDGYLRVATTDQSFWWWGEPAVVDVAVEGDSTTGASPDEVEMSPVSEDVSDSATEKQTAEEEPTQANNLLVLEIGEDSLDQVGELRGYGENEQIYAVRYMGDRAYVVTFRQTDPFYVMNLSDPANPSVDGELKITGFSNYLHPIDEDHIVGLGRQADENGRVTGFLLQVFDVSDASDPTQKHTFEIDLNGGWAWSQADHDPHAFVWYPKLNMLAIPLSIENYSDVEGAENFSGLAVFNIDAEEGITEAGRITHDAVRDATDCDAVTEDDGTPIHCIEPYYWRYPMQRSAFIGSDEAGDFLYGVSSLGMSVSDTDDIEDPIAIVPWN